MCLAASAAAPATPTIQETVDSSRGATQISFSPSYDGPLDLELAFEGDDPAAVMLFGLYTEEGDLLEVGTTYQGYDGHIARSAMADGNLTAGQHYTLVVRGSFAEGTLTLERAEQLAPAAYGIQRIHVQTSYSTNRVRITDSGYGRDTFLNTHGRPVVGLQAFATIHDGDPATNYPYGHMCFYSPSLPCEDTSVDLSHHDATLLTDDLTVIVDTVELDPESTTDLRAEFDVSHPIRHNVIQLQSFAVIPRQLER